MKRFIANALSGLLVWAAAVTAGAGLTGGAFAQDKVVNVYNWSDYIADTTIPDFEKQTGIKVNYDVFDNNTVVEAKLLTGRSGYDVVVPTSNFLERQIAAGVFMKLDKSKIPNLGNLDPTILKQVAVNDPGNEHGVVYMWGTTGLGYNVDQIKQRMPDAPVDSFDLIFKPEIAAKFADCGIALIDEAVDIYAAALNYLGLDPNSESEEDLEKAQALLEGLRPHIRYFNSSQYINDLANGNICIAFGYSGDILQARDRASEAGNDVTVAYTIPKEGTNIWFDMLAIPADAPHPDNAYAFINYLLEPAVAAANTNYVFYANPIPASLPMVSDEVKNDPGIYPPEAVKERLYALKAHSPRFDRLLTRAFTRLKTGR